MTASSHAFYSVSKVTEGCFLPVVNFQSFLNNCWYLFNEKYEKGCLLIDILNYTQQFFASCPSLTEIKEEILRYAKLEEEMKNLNPTIPLGPIELHTGMTFSYLCIYSKIMNIIVTLFGLFLEINAYNMNRDYWRDLPDWSVRAHSDPSKKSVLKKTFLLRNLSWKKSSIPLPFSSLE